jgi:hypothetical protein
MPTPFCKDCYAKMVANLYKRHGDDPTVSLDRRNVNFACKIPIYETNSMGRPTVKIWDCKKGTTMRYSQEEWDRKIRDEEA